MEKNILQNKVKKNWYESHTTNTYKIYMISMIFALITIFVIE